LDPTCFHGLQFPDRGGPLTGFATRSAESCGVRDLTVAEAEQVLAARIIAVDGATRLTPEVRLAGRARLVVYGEVATPAHTRSRRPEPRRRSSVGRELRTLRQRLRQRRRINPILLRLALSALAAFLLGTWYFHGVLHDSWIDAAYFVITTMTTTGYGDV